MKITKEDIEEIQKKWGDGIVAIGNAYLNGKDYKCVALNFIENLYAYEDGEVLFKPTKVTKKQFRITEEGALSYFVGGNEAFPEDKGFALQPWIKVRFENVGMYFHGDYAIAMGNYYFTSKQNKS